MAISDCYWCDGMEGAMGVEGLGPRNERVGQGGVVKRMRKRHDVLLVVSYDADLDCCSVRLYSCQQVKSGWRVGSTYHWSILCSFIEKVGPRGFVGAKTSLDGAIAN